MKSSISSLLRKDNNRTAYTLIFSDSIYRTSFILILSFIITSVLGILFWIVMVNFFDATIVGINVTIINLMASLSLISRMGLDQGLIRFLDDNPKYNKYLIISVVLLTSFLGIVLLLILSFFYFVFDTTIVGLYFRREFMKLLPYLFFFLGAFFWILHPLLNNLLIALKKGHLLLVKNPSIYFVKIFVPIIFLSLSVGKPFEITLAWFLVSLTINGIFLAHIIYSSLKLSTKIDFNSQEFLKIFTKMIRFSFGNYIAILFQSLLIAITPILILYQLNAAAVSYYYLPWTVTFLLLQISNYSSYVTIIESKNIKEAFANFKKALKFVMIFVIPFVIAFVLFPDIILRFFGADYSKNGKLLFIILAICVLPASINQLLIGIQRYQKRTFHLIVSNFFLLIILTVFQVLLLKNIGISIIGYAWFIGQSLILLGLSYKTYKDYQISVMNNP